MSRSLKAVVVSAVLLGATASADTSTEDVKKQAGKTVETAGKYVSERKDEFAARMQKKLDDANAELASLKADAAKTGEKASDAVQAKIHALEEQKKAAQEKLDELQKDTGSAWKRLKSGVEKAVDDVSSSVTGEKKI